MTRQVSLLRARSEVNARLQVHEAYMLQDPVWGDGHEPLTKQELLDATELTVVLPKAIIRNLSPNREGGVFLEQPYRPEVDITFLAEGLSLDRGDLLGDMEKALSGSPAIIHGCQDYRSPTTCHACSMLWRIRRMQRCVVDVDDE